MAFESMIILLAFNTKLPQSFEPLLSGHSDKTDEIRRSFLAVCIKTYVTDPNIKACAERAAWLGNGGDRTPTPEGNTIWESCVSAVQPRRPSRQHSG